MATKEEILKSQGIGQTIRAGLSPQTTMQTLKTAISPFPGSGQGLDRLAGLPYGLLAQLYGGAADITGGIGSSLGFDEFATNQYNRADDAYQAGMDKYTKGFGGSGGYSSLVTPQKPPSQKPPSQLEQIKFREQEDDIVNMMGGMPEYTGLPPAGQDSGLAIGDDSANIQNEIQRIKGGKEAEDFRSKEAQIIKEQGGVTNKDKGLIRSGENIKNMDDAFTGGMSAYMEALGGQLDDQKKKGQKPSKSNKELLEYYKKEFADATGISIDGKPDKRDALMAFGLALMQNKAGKGFNVGKMLAATGEAGEKAMPLLTKAKDKVEAGAIAAGKYALGQIAADKSSIAASNAAHKKFQQQIYLKNLEAELKAGEGKDFKNDYTKKYQVGAKPLEVNYAKVGNATKLLFPSQDVTELKNKYKDASDGYAMTEELKTVLSALDNASQSNITGSSAFEILKDKGKTLLKVFGLTDANSLYDDETYKFILEESGKEAAEKYKNNKSSLESSAQVLQDSLMARFKRFMTQETGNGIAVYDVESSKILTGKVNYLQDLNKNLQYISELQGLFGHSIDTLDDIIIDFYDKDLYTDEKEMNKTFGILNDLMETVYTPLRINPDNPQQVVDVSDVNINSQSDARSKQFKGT